MWCSEGSAHQEKLNENLTVFQNNDHVTEPMKLPKQHQLEIFCYEDGISTIGSKKDYEHFV
jgi:hypothetical protein